MRHYTRTELAKVYDHVLGERLPGAAEQGIHQLSTTQRYKIGARLQMGNKVYHYAHAGNICIPDAAVKVIHPEDISFATPVAALVTGATSMAITVAATDGPTANGLIPANYLEGGIVVVFPVGGNKVFNRTILSNTAQTVAAIGGPITVVLDAPIPLNVAIVGSGVVAMASVYANVAHYLYQVEAAGFSSTVGVATLPAVAGQYLWLQTWGPCWVAGSADLNVGVDNRAVGFKGDGGISDLDDAGNHVQILSQKAGHTLTNARGGGQGESFFMLQIDP